MTEQLRKIVESELGKSEELLWLGQPDAGDLVKKVTFGWVLVLASVFYESVSLALSADDNSDTLVFRIAALTVLSLIGAYVVCSIPKKAAKTVYAITSRRALRIDLNKVGHKALLSRFDPNLKSVVYQRHNTAKSFRSVVVCNSLVFMLWAVIFVPTILEHLDAYLFGGILLMILSAALYAYDQMIWFTPPYRNVSSTLYATNYQLTQVQALRLSDVTRCCVRRSLQGVADVFLISDAHGCMRIKSIVNADELVACLPQPLISVDLSEDLD